jgi:putative serine/threonine protein kinase
LKDALPLLLEKLGEEPYASIICYPKSSKAELTRRLRELRRLGVEYLEFGGEKQVFNLPLLGKGCVGIVTMACVKGEKVALKIRRVDADRSKMQREATLLKKANAVNVGPKLRAVSKNFLVMQFVNGSLLPKWLEKSRGKAQVKTVLHRILEQCWRLDEAGLDHGELSHAPKHVIINEEAEPFIVDFETASVNRRPSNLTSICQFLFIGSETARKVVEILGAIDKKAIVAALRRYKTDRSRGNFEKVMEVCGL